MSSQQCWAYNKEGVRCDQDAGHSGNHSIISEWQDEECFIPRLKVQSAQPIIVVDANDQPITPPAAPEPPAVKKCEICHHAHANGECRCGCLTAVIMP